MSFDRPPRPIAAAALVLAGFLGWAYANAADENREIEAELLKAKQIIVDDQKNASALRSDLQRLTKQNGDLQAELDRALAAAPGAKVQATGHFSTGPVPAGGTPRKEAGTAGEATPPGSAPRRAPRAVPHGLRPRPRAEIGSSLELRGETLLAQGGAAEPQASSVAAHPRPGTGPLEAGGAARAAAAPVPENAVMGPETRAATGPGACLLAAGDMGEIVVDQVTLRTEAGNYIIVGAASANRLAPPPETAMLHGPFRASLSESSRLREQVREGRSWGAGAYGGAWDGGRTLGAALALPQLRVLGHALEAIVTVGVWPDTQAGAVALARW